MRDLKGVRGTMEVVKELEFDKDTVYSRSNVVRIEEENFTGWQYDEIQYTYQEYISLQDERITRLNKIQKQQDQISLDNTFKIAMLESLQGGI